MEATLRWDEEGVGEIIWSEVRAKISEMKRRDIRCGERICSVVVKSR